MSLTPEQAFVGNCLIVFAFGFFTGFIELLSRYDSIKRLYIIRAGWFYMILNGLVALALFWLIESGDVKIAVDSKNSGPLSKVLLAGTSAMILLRSSIANVRLYGKEVEIGLASLIQILLNWINRTYDRENSKISLTEVGRIMANVNFDAAKIGLPYLCISVMRSLSESEAKHVGDQVSVIDNTNGLDPKTKAISMGLHLAKFMGTELLEEMVKQYLPGTPVTTLAVDDRVDSLMRAYDIDHN